MNFTSALRWILLLMCGVMLPSRTIAAEANDAAAKKTAATKLAAKDDTGPSSRPAITPNPSPATSEGSAVRPAAKENAEAISWLPSLNDGYRRALSSRKPIFIHVGATGCLSCQKLMKDVETPTVQAELARWTPVYLDMDAQPDDAAELGVVSVPALHIRTPAGQYVAEHDGYLGPDELVDWLKKHYEAATAAADDVLLASGEPTAMAVVRLVKQFQQRNPALREAAIRRLSPYPNIARPAVLRALQQGGLTTRLAAVEVLEQWKAPLDGLDPWRPETFTPQRLARLDAWKDRDLTGDQGFPKQLSKQQLAAARRQIDRMLGVDESEADAIRQRLARFGPALLPEVYSRLKDAAADQDRRRLLILRYRLAACDALVLRWPGGVERLGDTDARQRRQAAEELAKVAGADEKPLLLELFADSDPLVREISLRGLQHSGGREANAALVKLLGDPEPNVRAAVLKQLEESPDTAMVPAVVKYIKGEKDPDLIVHGICFLRAAKGSEATKCLMSLLKHKSWQVRAEAAVGIGKRNANEGWVVGGTDYSSSPGRPVSAAAQLQADAYVALVDLLDDDDAFVVAKAVEGLSNADMTAAVEPLVKAAAKHPDLTANVLSMLAAGNNMRQKAIPYFRKFCKHEKPHVRAAAIAALCSAVSYDVDDEMLAALGDKESDVRIAAASSLFKLMDQLREAAKNKADNATFTHIETSTSFTVETGSVTVTDTLLSKVAQFFGDGASAAPAPSVEPERPGDEKRVKPAAHAKPAKVAEKSKPVQETKKAAEAKPRNKSTPNDEKKTPAAEVEEEPNPRDQWLEDCYAGRGRPKWTSKMIAPLEKMLKAGNAKERVAAALALVPLGKAATAPAMLDTVRANHDQVEMAAEMLPWLVWKQRIQMFHDLYSLATNEQSRWLLIRALSESRDRRAAEPLWELLADAKVTNEEASAIQGALMVTYLGNRYYSSSGISAADRRDLAKAAKPRAEAGNEQQRFVALTLLADSSPDVAADVAARLAGDPKLGDSLRADAFQIQLLTQSVAEARKTSLAAMKGTDAARKRLSLKYLIHGSNELRMLRQGIFLYNVSNVTVYSSVQPGTPIVPKPPEGITIDDVRPLVGDSNAEVAACVGYLLALLGDPSAMEPLLQYWRQHGENSSEWKKLVYRAIAVTDDPKYIPVLREIYTKYEPSDYELREFYWTIRIMSGPEILKLRKQIRDEVGASQLGL